MHDTTTLPIRGGEGGGEVVATARGVFTHEGGTLSSSETGVAIIIPPGALPSGTSQEIYFKVCRDNSMLPPFDDSKDETLLSPLVMCGPHGIKFDAPVELRLPHWASAEPGDSRGFSLKSSEASDRGSTDGSMYGLTKSKTDPVHTLVNISLSVSIKQGRQTSRRNLEESADNICPDSVTHLAEVCEIMRTDGLNLAIYSIEAWSRGHRADQSTEKWRGSGEGSTWCGTRIHWKDHGVSANDYVGLLLSSTESTLNPVYVSLRRSDQLYS
uniref:ZU5 domain-containing protein n=1 Tax=Timema poppense TaxID=170557 RepID=A0A7R9CK40_TIMPO|nr:unnamed protein product [Timema poppensis]